MPKTTELFDRADAAYRALQDVAIDLEENQEVCGHCSLVYWSPLGDCPHCAADAGQNREDCLKGLAYRVNTDEKERE